MNPKTVLALFGAAAFGVVAGVAVDDGTSAPDLPAPRDDVELPVGVVAVELDDNGREPCTGAATYKGEDGVLRQVATELPCSVVDNFGADTTRVQIRMDSDGLCRGTAGSPRAGTVDVVVDCDALFVATKDAVYTRLLDEWPVGVDPPMAAKK